MENENNQEQELEETTEETSEESGDSNDNLEAELAKYKAIADRKTKQLDKMKEGLTDDNKHKEVKPVTEVQRLERLELKVDGYSEQEIDFILKNGGKEATGDEMVSSAIEAKRAKDKSEDATPEGSSKSPIFKRFTQDDLNKMSLEDLEKHIPKEE